MLKVTISDQNLELLPDYQQRIQVLQQLNYIDDQGTVQLKGRVACEINSADELLLTELVLDNVFADFEPAEVVALLSAFVFQERNASEPRLTPRLTKGKEIILTYARKVAQIQADCGLQISVEDYVNGLKFGLVEVVYEWAQGLVGV
jgi:antiviral helicase SKI2